MHGTMKHLSLFLPPVTPSRPISKPLHSREHGREM